MEPTTKLAKPPFGPYGRTNGSLLMMAVLPEKWKSVCRRRELERSGEDSINFLTRAYLRVKYVRTRAVEPIT